MGGEITWLQRPAAAPSVSELGAKARNLIRLCAAGLPVPEGFAIPAGSPALAAASRSTSSPPLAASVVVGAPGSTGLAARPRDPWEAVRAAAARLGPLLAVRSSSAVEDLAAGAAPGLFSSRLEIGPDELAAAVAEVVASARGPAVRAYLERRGASAPAAIAVIVQRQVRGASGVLYTRAPGRPTDDEVWIEAAEGALRRRATCRRSGEVVSRDADLPIGDDDLGRLVALAIAAEDAVAATDGADVEWVIEQGVDPRAIWLVQARPIRHGAVAGSVRAEDAAREDLGFSLADPGRTWWWDAAHNPDPLTPAQIGLVDVVADLSPWPLRVVDGYLYAAEAADPPQEAPTAAELEALFEDVRAAVERALAPVEGAPAPALPAALAAYRAVYEQYMVRLTPALGRARAALRARGEETAPLENAAGRAARRGDRAALDALAPVWDVAAPTYGERGGAAAHLAARANALPGTSELGAAVRTIGEEDDLLFFRAQRAVRRALLAAAATWRLASADDVFYLPLSLVLAHVERGEPLDRAAAHRAAEDARAVRAAQRARSAPIAIRGGRGIAGAASGPFARAHEVAGERAGRQVWRGIAAASGAARGPALAVGDLGALGGDPRGAVVIARSVTPAAILDLDGAAALVCEQGGALDHAAALARELGLPCVVGCAGVWAGIRSGDEVLVDGDAGLVVVL